MSKEVAFVLAVAVFAVLLVVVLFWLLFSSATGSRQPAYHESQNDNVQSEDDKFFDIDNGKLDKVIKENKTTEKGRETTSEVISLDVGRRQIQLEDQESFFFSMSPNVDTGQIDETSHLIFRHEVSPNTGGLIVANHNPVPSGGYKVGDTNGLVHYIRVEGIKPGTYTVISTIEIVETGESTSEEWTVFVSDNEAVPELSIQPPAIIPSGVTVGETADIFFATGFTLQFPNRMPNLGTSLLDKDQVKNLELVEIDVSGNVLASVGLLLPDPEDPARRYTGTFTITTDKEAIRFFRAQKVHNGKLVVSEKSRLVVSAVTERKSTSSDTHIIEHPNDPSIRMLSNRVLVGLKDDSSIEDLQSIVDEMGGEIVNSIASLLIFEIEFSTDGTYENLAEIVQQLKQYPEIRSAEPNKISSPN